MRQQVIIPWRDVGEPWRKKHFDFLSDYYSKEFDIVLGDVDGEFNRSAARNAGLEISDSEVSVIIDADNFFPINNIFDAVSAAKRKDILVKPFSSFGYLTEESTNTFYNNFGTSSFNPLYLNPPQGNFTGGSYVMKKSLWQSIGGMDEGFIGWGAEDDAFHLLCKHKEIVVRYIEGNCYHLYHPAYRVTSDFNYDKLVKEYIRGNKSS
jgi:glycosyltransferase involved in cell wall biosynthesis